MKQQWTLYDHLANAALFFFALTVACLLTGLFALVCWKFLSSLNCGVQRSTDEPASKESKELTHYLDKRASFYHGMFSAAIGAFVAFLAISLIFWEIASLQKPKANSEARTNALLFSYSR